MTSWKSRLERIRGRPGGTSSRELISVLSSLDCSIRKGKGSHLIVRHARMPRFFLTVPNQNPLKEIYVSRALELIDELLMELGLED